MVWVRIDATRPSLQLGARALDHGSPALDLGIDKAAKLGRRQIAEFRAIAGPDRLEFIGGDGAANLVHDARLYLRWRPFWRPQTVPGGHGVLRQAQLASAGDVGEGRVAFRPRYHQGFDASALDV